MNEDEEHALLIGYLMRGHRYLIAYTQRNVQRLCGRAVEVLSRNTFIGVYCGERTIKGKQFLVFEVEIRAPAERRTMGPPPPTTIRKHIRAIDIDEVLGE